MNNFDLMLKYYKNKQKKRSIPLTFTAVTDSYIDLYTAGNPDKSGIYYKVNDGEWINFDVNTTRVELSVGDKVQFKNTNDILSVNASNYFQFSINGGVNGSGNIMSMQNYKPLTERCFYNLFNNCQGLLSVPELPAKTLATHCYLNMFRGCTNMSGSVILPAISLAEGSCLTMFYGCSSLQSANIYATQLVTNCFSYMFYGCSALNNITVNFTNWVNGATDAWVTSTSSSGTFTKPTSLEEIKGSSNIPSNWTVVNA